MTLSRRTFMKIAAISGATLAADSGIKYVDKLVPYAVPPEKISPVAWQTIATTCRECPAGCGMHIRHTNGRITKAEGNPDHPVNRGGLCPRGQSALQGIYDPDRVGPVHARDRKSAAFRQETWEKALAEIGERIRKAKGRVALMSRLETGTLAEIIASFVVNFGSDRFVLYEAFSYDPLRRAHGILLGQPAIPYYHLNEADYILSFGADFLESWVSNVQFSWQFAEMHELRNDRIGRFDYIGPRLSMTAANADRFVPLLPGREKDIALALLKIMDREGTVKVGRDAIGPLIRNVDIRSVQRSGLSEQELRAMAKRFGSSRSVALAGPVGASGPGSEQLALAVTLLNAAAGSIGTIVDLSRPHALSRTASEGQMALFLNSITPDDVLIIHKTNPVYTRPGSEELLSNAGLIVYLGTMMDETASVADWFLPVHDDLESWGEYEPWAGVRSLMQPAMRPTGPSMDAGDLLIRLAGAGQKILRRGPNGEPIGSTREWLEQRWNQEGGAGWEDSLRRGGSWSAFQNATGTGSDLRQVSIPLAMSGEVHYGSDQAALWLWPSIMFFDGRTANRGWMQEAPEPVSTISWDSWIDIHPKKATILGIQDQEIVELTAENRSILAPVRITEEVAKEVVALCFGQGHSALGSIASNRGANAFMLLPQTNDFDGYFGRVAIKKTGRTGENALAMTTRDQHERELLQWVHLDKARTMKPGPLVLPLREGYTRDRDLYPPHQHKGHRWAMAIDLQRCIGCGACAVACYAENNIPVVGKKRFREGRHLSWLRVVPYRRNKENALKIAWLPMLCQHCDSAPCEPVCPVYASVNNEEGLNAQIYNRCIGTRYCSNNCPYKVRRFNWLNIKWEKSLSWQLNPEVTVRVRGVMEKCTFCIQRIRNAQHRAKRENRKVKDGEIQPACVQSCPAKVFTFGDLLDPESKVSRITREHPRRYHVLEELNTKPAVTYLFRILQEKE